MEEHDDYFINAVGRKIPKVIPGYPYEVRPFAGGLTPPKGDEHRPHPPVKFARPGESKMVSTLQEAMVECGLTDGMTISYHHHLRNGDNVANMIFKVLRETGVHGIELAPSSVHPVQKDMRGLIDERIVTRIHTGTNGPVGKYCSEGHLEDVVIVRSHGGRVRAICEGDIHVDIAVIAASAADLEGNATGIIGPSACGPLAYAEADARFADKTIIVTDNLVSYPCTPISIPGTYVDHVVVVDKIGNPAKIASTTTRLSMTEPGLTIAKTAAELIALSGYMKEGFSFQAGAGGASLASVYFLAEKMREAGVVAGWANGGTTKYITDMLHEGLVRKVSTCQAFDTIAISSMYDDMKDHFECSIDMYANPFNRSCVVHQLDTVCLGATEVDLNFNVNVNTHSDGYLLHNTGGHQDTAQGAKLTIITCPVARGNNPIIVPSVTTVTTPGECVDAIVTDVGIAINPLRTDLIERFADSDLPITTLEELHAIATKRAGRVGKAPIVKDRVIGVIEWRDGTVIDVVYEVANPIPDDVKLKSDCLITVERHDGPNEVEITLYDASPMISEERMAELGLEMMTHFGVENCKMHIFDRVSEEWCMAARMEYALKEEFGVEGEYLLPVCEEVDTRVQRPRDAFRRSMLYIPGNSPYMMAKADTSAADAIIYDLEDAVALPGKAASRILVRNALRAVPFHQTERQIRINQGDLGDLDLETIIPHAPVDLIFVPKVETPEMLTRFDSRLADLGPHGGIIPYVVPLLETAVGVENAYQIAQCSQNIVGLSMGLEDYTADIGAIRSASGEESAWAQQRVMNAAAAFQLQSYDSVFSDFNDPEGLKQVIYRQKAKGFVGKRLIHPNQVDPCNEAFLPGQKELDYAKRVVVAFRNSKGDAVALGRKMIDIPVCHRAVALCKLAHKAGMLEEEFASQYL